MLKLRLFGRILLVSMVAWAAWGGCSSAPKPASTPPAPAPFAFSIELTPDGARMESRTGTGWTSTSWSAPSDGPCRFYIGKDGVAGRADLLAPDGFCLAVEKSGTEVLFTAVRGVAWQTLRCSCVDAGACRFEINQGGVCDL